MSTQWISRAVSLHFTGTNIVGAPAIITMVIDMPRLIQTLEFRGYPLAHRLWVLG